MKGWIQRWISSRGGLTHWLEISFAAVAKGVGVDGVELRKGASVHHGTECSASFKAPAPAVGWLSWGKFVPQSAPGNTTTPLISSSNLVVETFRGGDGNCPLFFTMHGLGSYDTLLWNYMSKNTPMWLNGRILSLAGPKCFSFKFKIVVFFTHSSILSGCPQVSPSIPPWPAWMKLFLIGMLISTVLNVPDNEVTIFRGNLPTFRVLLFWPFHQAWSALKSQKKKLNHDFEDWIIFWGV